jgi:hypothetical protein
VERGAEYTHAPKRSVMSRRSDNVAYVKRVAFAAEVAARRHYVRDRAHVTLASTGTRAAASASTREPRDSAHGARIRERVNRMCRERSGMIHAASLAGGTTRPRRARRERCEVRS